MESSNSTPQVNMSTTHAIPSSSVPSQSHFIENLVKAVDALSSGEGYRTAKGLVEQLSDYRTRLDGQTRSVEQMRQQITNLEASNRASRQDALDTYRASHASLEQTNARLLEESSGLRARLEESARAAENDRANEKMLSEKVRSLTNSLRASGDARQKSDKTAEEHAAKLKNTLVRMSESVRELAQEKETTKTLRTKVKDLEKEKNAAVESREQAEKACRKMESFMVPMERASPANLAQRFGELWQHATTLICHKFWANLKPLMLTDERLWLRLTDDIGIKHQIPLPHSNSNAAKQMRISITLAFLARNLDRHIVQPSYLLETDSGLRESLLRLAIEDSQKESFCRASMLAISPDEQDGNLIDRKSQVVSNVMWFVQFMLFEDDRDQFRAELEKLVDEACDFWRMVQHLRVRYEPSFELVSTPKLNWQPMQFDLQTSGPADLTDTAVSGTGDAGILAIFPRLYIAEDHDPSPISCGTALKRSQTMAAAEEAEKDQGISSAFGRAMSVRTQTQRRRISTSENDQHNRPRVQNAHGHEWVK